MEVVRVLHMNGGVGESSYAKNSLVQKKVIFMTKPITEAAITELIISSSSSSSSSKAKTFCMAELGCSSGPNTLFVAMDFVKIVSQLCRKHGHDELPEFQIHLNDLPGNDFNSIFKSLAHSFHAQLLQEMGASGAGGSAPYCFLSGVPGSFYSRLFAAKSLHFVHSSYSLMWLSKVPEGLEMNRANIYIASTTPASVINAYYEQFQRDFSTFLRCRSEEVVDGGKMVLTLLGRKSESASSKECCYIWELLALSLKEMVSQGLIEEEKLGSFNIPQYTPSLSELKTEVEKEGSFCINSLEASEITWAACGDSGFYSPQYSGKGDDGYNVATCMRSVAEPLLVEHFGELVIDHLFEIYRNILSDRMSKEDTKFVNVTVSLTRKE